MNYQKVYDELIERARRRVLSSEYELHHVVPRAIDGSDTNTDVVQLTHREHFIAHLLLAKICEIEYGKYHTYARKMKQAVHRMYYGKHSNSIINTSWKYELARKYCAEAKKGIKFPLKEKTIEKQKQRKWYKDRGLEIPEELRPGYRPSLKTRKGKTREQLLEEAYQMSYGTGYSNVQYDFYKNMTDEEFDNWMKNRKLFVNERWGNKRINPNVIRALTARKIPLKVYFKEEDFAKSWFDVRIHQVVFYGE